MVLSVQRRRVLLALICLPIFIGALDLTVVSAVLPQVILDLEIPLQSGLDDAAWMVSGYLLAYAISMTFMGRFSDLYGRRRVFLAALAIFAFGSYFVAVAHTWPTNLALRGYYLFASGRPDVSQVNLYVLIGGRMIQAFGAGSMVPVGMALVGDVFPKAGRASALGLIAAVDTAGWVVGHLYGGIVLRFWDWHTIFWLNLPICAFAFALIWAYLRDVPQKLHAGKMDWASAALISGALMLFNFGLGNPTDSVNIQGDANPIGWGLLLAALGLLALFIWRQARVNDPLVDLRLFQRQNFAVGSLANFLIGISLFIAIANVPLFINSFKALTAEQAAWDSGWMLSALTLPLALASLAGGRLADKRGYRLPTLLGLGIALGGFLLMSRWLWTISYEQMAAHLVPTGIGIGLTMAPIAAAVVNSAPEDQRGSSSALVIIFRLVGMTLGVSGITTYGLQRAEEIGRSLLPVSASASQTLQASLQALEQVIQETFIIASIITALAVLPGLLLKAGIANREDKHG